MNDLERLTPRELIDKLNEACRMVVEERSAAFRLARLFDSQDDELRRLRRQVQTLQAALDEERKR